MEKIGNGTSVKNISPAKIYLWGKFIADDKITNEEISALE